MTERGVNLTEKGLRVEPQQLLSLQLQTGLALGSAKDLRAGLSDALSVAGGCFVQSAWRLIIFWMLDESAQKLKLGALWCGEELDLEGIKRVAADISLGRGEGLAGRSWIGRSAVWLADDSFHESAIYAFTGLYGVCAFPVESGENCLGILELYSSVRQEPDSDFIKALLAVSTQIAQFIVRCRAEEKLAAEGSLLRTVLSSVPVFFYVKDLNNRFVLNNQAHLQVLQATSPADVLGKTDFDFFPPELASRYLQDEKQILQTGEPLINREEPIVTPDGRHLWALTTKAAIRDAQGRIFGLVGITRDITERREAEQKLKDAYRQLEIRERDLKATLCRLEASTAELRSTQLQLIHAAKLESVGTLSAAVAHEVKNPLQTVLMGLDFLENNVPRPKPDISLVLAEMRNAVRRAKDILAELLQLSAGSDLALLPQSLNPIIERSLWLMNFDLSRSHVSIQTELQSDLPLVLVDKGKIEQVFINLFSNALHAMPQGGTLSVSSRTEVFQRPGSDTTFGEFLPGERLVTVEVRDTGVGIPPDNLGKVFDAFFTTKAPGVGTGLGLSIVKKIMKLHHGAVQIQNVAPHGVLVKLFMKGEKPCAPTREESSSSMTSPLSHACSS